MIIDRITSQVGYSDSFATNPYFAEIDKQQYVIKHIKNDESHISLFNELLGYKLAEKFGIKTPVFGYCYYKMGVTKINPDLDIDNIEDGDIFTYTKHITSAFSLMDTGTLQEFTNEEILRLIVFDCVICNTDRNSNNILMRPIGKHEQKNNDNLFELIPIDYTHILPDGVNWNYSLVNKNKSRDYPSVKDIIQGNYYELLLNNRAYTKEMLASEKNQVIEILKKIEVPLYIDEVPKEITCKFDETELQLLIDFFDYRKKHIGYIYDEIISEFERRGIA